MTAEQMIKNYEDETTLKYIFLEELDAINAQIAELGWCSEKSKEIDCPSDVYELRYCLNCGENYRLRRFK